VFTLAVLAALGVVAYLRSAQLPFISDDYIQVDLGWKYGALSGWRDLILDPLYRCRSTSLVLTYWTWRFFDLNPLAYNWSSIVLHVLNTWLVFGLGAWRLIGWRPAAVAAGFFAIYEGHQEAIMWYAALPELLVFFFTVLAFLCWVLWLQSGCRRHRYYVAALAAFLLALASKESSVVAVPLMLAAAAVERPRWRQTIPRLVPMAVLGVAYALLIHASRSEHLFYHDGTFSLSAPFLKTLMVSVGRLFWFWGLASVLVLLALRPSRWRRTLMFAAIWIVVTFLPYSFLTYMPRVPSRHTYLASAGLSLVVAAALLAFRARAGRAHSWAMPVLVALLVVHNCGYIWTRKQAQYLERAAPTESLLRFARRVPGPIYLRCFPYGPVIAQLALEVTGAKPSNLLLIGGTPPSNAVPFCYGDFGRDNRGGESPPSASLGAGATGAGPL
jgi:hypothetical protein